MNKISTHAVRQGAIVNLEGNETIKVPISKNEDEFIVVNLITAITPPPSHSIVSALFEIDPKIYEKSFGPDTFVACKQYLKENTVAKKPFVMELSGGGGRWAPRGLL